MRYLVALVLASSLLPLCGCGISSSTSTAGTSQGSPGAGRTAMGRVHGGQNPVIGSVIQLWAVGTAGYGSAATPLISTNVKTDSNGFFDITNDYSCVGNPLVYLTATGGNTGGPGDNANLLLMAALGYCNSLTSSTYIYVNEVTTVAAAYALGQFTNTATGSIGSWGYSNTGLVNAFSTAKFLADTSNGNALASTSDGSGTVPQSEINTLANIMAACVNSVSSNAALSSSCSSYFTAATPPGGSAPTDTFDAMVDIAHNPGRNVTTLFDLGAGNPPFNPGLGAAPTDWTMGISYTAKGSGSVAIDGAGNVWHMGVNPAGGNALYVVSPAGTMTMNAAYGGVGNLVAIDTNGHGWVYKNVGTSGGILTGVVLSTSGGVSSLSTYAGPFTLPITDTVSGMAIDGSNNIWLTPNSGLTKVNTSGTTVGTYTGGGYNSGGAGQIYPAIDNNGNVWLTETSPSPSVSEFSNSGTALSPSSGFSAQSQRAAAAIDASGDVWLANTGNLLTELSSTGAMLSPGGGFPSPLAAVFAVAVDSHGTVWLTSDDGTFSFTHSGVLINSTPYSEGSTGFGENPAIDASGNLWFTGFLARGSNPFGLTEDVGVAGPVITPLASAIATHQLGTLPGTPIPVVMTSTQIPSSYGNNTAYSAQLHATGGNTGTYLWSLSSGALPNGFTLNSSTGLISGASRISGTSSFTVQVCDAQNSLNCTSQAFTLNGAFGGSVLPTLGGEGLLSGIYIFRVTGTQNSGASPTPGSVAGMAMVGYVGLNGIGQVSSGNFYVVSPQGSLESLTSSSVYGSYNLPAGGNGTGHLAFADGNGNWYQFSIAAAKVSGGVVQELRLTEFDDTQSGTGSSGGATASGVAKLQTGGNNTAYLEQSWAFGLEGETPCTNYNSTNPTCAQTVAPFGPLAAAGMFTGTSATALSGKLDAAGVGTSYNSDTLTGTWTQPDLGFGFRGSFTLTYSGTTFPMPPTHFVYYPVSSSEFFFISTDSHATTSMLSGDAIAQTGPFTNNTFYQDYVGTESVASGGDGLSVYGSTVKSTVRFIDSNGATAVMVSDENNAGTLSQLALQGASTYTVDSVGRTTFSQAGFPVYYLANSTQGFGVEQPAAGKASGLITLTYQPTNVFSTSSLSGTYAFSDLSVPVQNTTADGLLTADGVSAGTITADEVSTGGLLFSTSQSQSYTMPNDGRGTLTLADGTGYIVWLLSPTQWIALPTGTDPKPLILTGTQQ